MNNLIEKTVNHLSKTAERIIPEKSMTDAEIEKLLSDTENAVDKIVNDKERPSSERKEARGVRKFLNGVRKDWKKWKSSPQSDYLSNENEHRSEFWKVWIHKIWI